MLSRLARFTVARAKDFLAKSRGSPRQGGRAIQNISSVLSAERIELLRRMQADYEPTPPPFQVSSMWSGIRHEFEERLHAEGIGEVESQQYNALFAQSTPGSPRYYRYALWMLFKQVKARDHLGILGRVEPSIQCDSPYVFEFEGKRVSWDLLISIDSLYAIDEARPGVFTDDLVIVDLGAGWGRIGYVLKKVNPRCTYVAADIPESLLLSSTRLPQLLPEERLHTYDAVPVGGWSRRQLADGGLWFCGPHHLAEFEDGSVDVLINVASFQEMTLSQVDGYFSLIDRKVSGVLYLQEYWAHPQLSTKYGVIAGFENYPFRPTWKRIWVRNASFSERYFETAYTVGGKSRQ